MLQDSKFCYVCLNENQDITGFRTGNMESQYPICQDCIDDKQVFKNWNNQAWKQRPQEYQKKKQEEKKSKEQTSKIIKQENKYEEEQKQSTGNVFIILEQQAIKYQTHGQKYSLVELQFNLQSLIEAQLCQFSLVSCSAGYTQLQGLQMRDLIITGGINYSELTFYAGVYPKADQIKISSGPNLIEERHSHAVGVSSSDGKSERVFVVGGINLSKEENKAGEVVNLSRTIEVLNLEENEKWEKLKDFELNQGRISPSAVVFGDFLYVLGGFLQNSLKSQQLPVYSDNSTRCNFIERFNITNNSNHTVLDVKCSKPQNFPIASFNILPFYNEKQVLVLGGTTGKRILQSVYRLKFQQDKEDVACIHELQMQFPHANAMVSRVGDGVYIFGGAQSQGGCEYFDINIKEIQQIFDFSNCLNSASKIGEIEHPDLRWSCCFFK